MVKEVVKTRESRESTIKKRRKNSTNVTDTIIKNEEDIYQKITEFEELEAFKRSPEKDAELYFQTSNNIRTLLTKITNLKKIGTPESIEEIAEKRVETTMLIAILKKLNRLEKFRTKSARDALHQEKLQTDSTKLQLQNLLYELSYLKKEISKCFQFKSLDEEIELISQDEFYEKAPSTIAREEVTKSNPHQLQLARLEWELQQRKELSSQCKQLEVQKESVAEQIVVKRERLEKLTPQLSSVLESMKPLQEHLGLVKDKTQDHKLAYLLPKPLYLLYAKVLAYTAVYDSNTEIQIIGTEEEARQLKDESEVQNITADSDSDLDNDTQEELTEREKHHHRKASRSQQQEEKHNKLLASHPLNVQIKIALANDSKSNLVLDFYYKIKLNVVTVKCQVHLSKTLTGILAEEVLLPEAILRELFPHDLGEDSPNPTNNYQLNQIGLGNFSSLVSDLGYPYIWAQQICGLDFITIQPPEDDCANNNSKNVCLESIMKIIRYRFWSRVCLSEQIQELENNTIPIVSADFSVPSKLTGNVSQWKRITWEDCCSFQSTKKYIPTYINCSDMFYGLTITRGAAKLDAVVTIKNSFPKGKSIFVIQINWNGTFDSTNSDAVREMECAVNTEWPEDLKKNEIWLLSAQIRRLVACFDIYLEVTSPSDYTQDKIFFKSTRGRNRNLPFKFLKLGGGIFMQY